jgi:hypothetical protein
LKKEEAEHLLDHWIEHNISHSGSFRKWATQVRDVSERSSKEIEEAADIMDKCTEQLKKAKDDLH